MRSVGPQRQVRPIRVIQTLRIKGDVLSLPKSLFDFFHNVTDYESHPNEFFGQPSINSYTQITDETWDN